MVQPKCNTVLLDLFRQWVTVDHSLNFSPDHRRVLIYWFSDRNLAKSFHFYSYFSICHQPCLLLLLCENNHCRVWVGSTLKRCGTGLSTGELLDTLWLVCEGQKEANNRGFGQSLTLLGQAFWLHTETADGPLRCGVRQHYGESYWGLDLGDVEETLGQTWNRWMDSMAVDHHGGFSSYRRGGLGWSIMRMDIVGPFGLGRWC